MLSLSWPTFGRLILSLYGYLPLTGAAAHILHLGAVGRHTDKLFEHFDQ
jgi:hypothetical protein